MNTLHILIAAAMYTPLKELLQNTQDALRRLNDDPHNEDKRLYAWQHTTMLSLRFEHEGKSFSEVLTYVEQNARLIQLFKRTPEKQN